MKKFFTKLVALIPKLALRSGILAANSACSSYYYQIETPEAMNEYRK